MLKSRDRSRRIFLPFFPVFNCVFFWAKLVAVFLIRPGFFCKKKKSRATVSISSIVYRVKFFSFYSPHVPTCPKRKLEKVDSSCQSSLSSILLALTIWMIKDCDILSEQTAGDSIVNKARNGVQDENADINVMR